MIQLINRLQKSICGLLILVLPITLAFSSATAQTPSQATSQATNQTPAGRLPNLGEEAEMSPAAERRLGDRIARELYRDPDYIDDPVLVEYLQAIWQSLLTAARLRGELTPELEERFAFELLLGKDRTVNAFALPGGYMGLHLGLVAVVSSRDELAAVLGHELSHITQRHIARLTAKQSAQTPWLVGAMILGALAASKNPQAVGALISGGQAVAAQNQLNFSRDMEREADRVGFAVMTQAGFEGQGAVSMFEKLQQANRLSDRGNYPYLRSHPLTTERIADMQSRVGVGVGGGVSLGAGVGSSGPQTPAAQANPTLEHAMVAARARLISNQAQDALRAWVQLDSDPALGAALPFVRAGNLYGAAMAAARQRDFALAQKIAARLGPVVQNDAAAQRLQRLLAAEIALEAGQPAQVLALLADAAKPGTATTKALGTERLRPEQMLLVPAQIRLGQAAQAAETLRLWVALHPRDAMAWQWLATSYTELNQPLRAVRADAESRVAEQDYAGAQERFKAAQDLAKNALGSQGRADHIEASIIDTRARAVALLLREQALER